MLGDTGYKRAVRILLECILVELRMTYLTRMTCPLMGFSAESEVSCVAPKPEQFTITSYLPNNYNRIRHLNVWRAGSTTTTTVWNPGEGTNLKVSGRGSGTYYSAKIFQKLQDNKENWASCAPTSTTEQLPKIIKTWRNQQLYQLSI